MFVPNKQHNFIEITDMAHGVVVVSHAASIAAFEDPYNKESDTQHSIILHQCHQQILVLITAYKIN